MKEKHIVLRSTRSLIRDPLTGPLFTFRGSAEPIAAGVTAEFVDMESRQISTVTRHADVLAVAPAIPMKLVTPVSVAQQDAEVSDGIAWGIRAVRADTSPFTGEGITVAVLDTGIDGTHAAFSGVEIIQKNFTEEVSDDLVGHGTHCAGTIFGRTTNDVRIGVAPKVERALIGKVLSQKGGSSDQIVQAILWAADQGVNVISMSLGLDFPGFVKQLEEMHFPTELATSRALEGYRLNVLLFERLVSLVRAQGAFCVVVAAAGNESRRNINPDFEIAVSPPAVSEGIVSVAALGRSAQGLSIADFSNTGANVSGPGVGIRSAMLGGGLTSLSGTSMATPHAAGVAALWAEKIQRTGSLNARQLEARLIGSASEEGIEHGFDPVDIGAGLVQAPQN